MEGSRIVSLLVTSQFAETFTKFRSNGDKMGDNERSKSRTLRFTIFEFAAVGRQRHFYLDCVCLPDVMPVTAQKSELRADRIVGDWYVVF